MQRHHFAIALAAGLITAAPVLARPAVSASHTEVVPLRMNAGQIRDLQTSLNSQGFSPGDIDGLWGPNTAAALRRFQAAKGLHVSGRFDRATLAALTAGGSSADTASGAPPAASAPANGDGTTGTTANGANAGGSNAGVQAASGNNNQAIATTNANAPQPAHGANSFSKGEAVTRISNHGFQNVANLAKDGTGVWRGTATKDGQPVQVWLDYKGNVGQQ